MLVTILKNTVEFHLGPFMQSVLAIGRRW